MYFENLSDVWMLEFLHELNFVHQQDLSFVLLTKGMLREEFDCEALVVRNPVENVDVRKRAFPGLSDEVVFSVKICLDRQRTEHLLPTEIFIFFFCEDLSVPRIFYESYLEYEVTVFYTFISLTHKSGIL